MTSTLCLLVSQCSHYWLSLHLQLQGILNNLNPSAESSSQSFISSKSIPTMSRTECNQNSFFEHIQFFHILYVRQRSPLLIASLFFSCSFHNLLFIWVPHPQLISILAYTSLRKVRLISVPRRIQKTVLNIIDLQSCCSLFQCSKWTAGTRRLLHPSCKVRCPLSNNSLYSAHQKGNDLKGQVGKN